MQSFAQFIPGLCQLVQTVCAGTLAAYSIADRSSMQVRLEIAEVQLHQQQEPWDDWQPEEP